MSNEVILVDQFVKDAQSSRQSALPDDIAFEHFAASMALNDDLLSDDQIEAGRIGGGRDGGIDAVYTFLDGRLLDEDADVLQESHDPRKIRKGAELTLCLIQAKRSEGFGEDAFNRVRASTEKLLDLNSPESELRTLYSSDLIARLGIFTTAWTKLIVRSPRISIRFVYATRGDTTVISAGVKSKIKDLDDHFELAVPGAVSEVELLGARELWRRADSTPDYDQQLRFRDYVSEGDSYVGLVSLPDYFQFLSDGSGNLKGFLFDSNVRDFQGAVAVNRQIRTTLESDNDRDFWWLNNGVTILCTDANISGDKTFTLFGVQIVNGMQTSHAIHDVLSAGELGMGQNAKRSVQVRVIKTEDEATRDEIIRATNSQTKVPDASLHATEDLHRQIEAHFGRHGWYYDRRKNFYKNAGKPADKIISIPMLGQAIMAIGLGRPDNARARPTTLLNKRTDYEVIFDPKLPLNVYLWVASVQRRVDALLLGVEEASEASVRTNTKFYVSCYLVTKAFGAEIFNPRQLIELAETPLETDSSDVGSAVEVVLTELNAVAAANTWQPERASKSHQLVDAVIERALTAASASKEATGRASDRSN